MIPTCPKCGLPANDIAPIRREAGAFELFISSRMTVLGHCDNGHSFFTDIRFNDGGEVAAHVSGLAGTRSPWAKEEP